MLPRAYLVFAETGGASQEPAPSPEGGHQGRQATRQRKPPRARTSRGGGEEPRTEATRHETAAEWELNGGRRGTTTSPERRRHQRRKGDQPSSGRLLPWRLLPWQHPRSGANGGGVRDPLVDHRGAIRSRRAAAGCMSAPGPVCGPLTVLGHGESGSVHPILHGLRADRWRLYPPGVGPGAGGLRLRERGLILIPALIGVSDRRAWGRGPADPCRGLV